MIFLKLKNPSQHNQHFFQEKDIKILHCWTEIIVADVATEVALFAMPRSSW